MDGLFHRELRRILKVDDFWYPQNWETFRPCHFLGVGNYVRRIDELSVLGSMWRVCRIGLLYRLLQYRMVHLP